MPGGILYQHEFGFGAKIQIFLLCTVGWPSVLLKGNTTLEYTRLCVSIYRNLKDHSQMPFFAANSLKVPFGNTLSVLLWRWTKSVYYLWCAYPTFF